MQQLKRFALTTIATMIVLAAILGLLSCSPQGYSGPVASVSIGTTTREVNSLILIAQERGYFTANGLNVTHRIYPSGVVAIGGMLNREVDLATGSEFALVGKVLSRENIRTIAIINRSSVEYLVGRVDKGINNIADLKGKRIGVPLKSRPEFSLDRFLDLRGVDASELNLVDVPLNQSVDALVSGKVDAVTAWQPYISQIRERMGNKIVVWNTQENQPSYNLVMGSGTWTGDNPEVIKRFLKSLIQAESYYLSYPEAARSLIGKRLNYSEDYIASVLPDNYFSVSLDQSLILAMEDEARWMIRNNLTAEKKTPDFGSYIYIDGLKAVKPEAVNIIR